MGQATQISVYDPATGDSSTVLVGDFEKAANRKLAWDSEGRAYANSIIGSLKWFRSPPDDADDPEPVERRPFSSASIEDDPYFTVQTFRNRFSRDSDLIRVRKVPHDEAGRPAERLYQDEAGRYWRPDPESGRIVRA